MPDTLRQLSPPGAVHETAVSWSEFSARFSSSSTLLKTLTRAEGEVTLHLRLGLSNKEIASALGKSPATVKAQVASILRKVNLPTRGRLIAWLYEQTNRTSVT